jgi:hypothetical protein
LWPASDQTDDVNGTRLVVDGGKILVPGFATVEDPAGRDAPALLDREAPRQSSLIEAFPSQDDGAVSGNSAAEATLWFLVAIYHYLGYTGDADFVRKGLLPVPGEIIGWFEKGTRHGFHVRDDGRLYSGEPGHQLTGMDVKIGDVLVTPRQG